MSPDWRGVLTMTDLSPSDIERMQNPSASDIERRVETLSPSDLETMEKLTAEMNAEVLQNNVSSRRSSLGQLSLRLSRRPR
jgi:hypothetical protein